MTIIDKKLHDLKIYENNPRNNDTAVNYVAESIREFGFKVPVIIDSNNVIIAGHTRLKAAEKLGLETVPCIIADDLTPDQVKAFRLADNKVSEFSTWDLEKLTLELNELPLEMDVFGFEKAAFSDDGIGDTDKENTGDNGSAEKAGTSEDKGNPYTTKIDIPQYQITGECPDIGELLQTEKAMSLIEEINQSGVSGKEKEFLRFSAFRHLLFRYDKIAEYYAHANKEMQELMEKSALVIIDFNDAIKNGYAILSEEISKMYDEDEKNES